MKWKKIHHLETIDSTNNYAGLNPDQFELPFVVTSDYQEGGRGQGINTWISDKGKNLLVSIVCSPVDLTVDRNFYISKINALSVVSTIRTYYSGALIKWPNDILCDGKKISGTLIENTIYKNLVSKTIIGTGLNINQDVFPSMEIPAVSLAILSGKKYPVGKFLEEYLENFSYYSALLDGRRYEIINREYFTLLLNYEKWADYKTGTQRIEARIIDVADNGMLKVVTREGKALQYGFGEIKLSD